MMWFINNGSDSTGFYFYSSLIQVKAAIFSIYGLFIVFKIQMSSQIIETCKNFIASSQGNIIAVTKFDESNMEDKQKFIDIKKEAKKATSGFTEIHHYQKWFDSIKAINEIKINYKIPMILLVIGMVIDSLALLFQKTLQQKPSVEMSLYIVSMTLFVIVLCWIYYGITKILSTK
ncbi:MAG: hypothetical protein A2509_08700 [Candidatus Edwardsbacteria bacterium RIFOXYD12_FULL_50_11]|uniref:Uncharacterized protein n=1 Tax=Candidatus Edwardsbacteria bacterium GWF2_54_11 TaxID=1817851 RepID=A0A1F5REX8_9BACT|nr:MAG: hypothetical protein A2502_02070 [Candidatus Edwardsbacteria bacterium RifOxyC12_full_54_24]OGF09051.1 MAG: hypothetical protein A2273_10525 [Candidatus Edwardsbacteria bacterium RifOxyA12_full_54_48]OGF12424.1 MAG: hypothetical protein A3K15_01070 [Candidatus Edwardsbacteria bacterium GWE2_54_12]OGF12938.1 MAG: hypothetical protein A2024_11980 [Candidatus Edwardsbacteria bacterium GWF2_54_11]OGF17472.1 MAG: hypothetical protein A2509_08700 [Candidatus Edwardsbacteria bacterium RIFOXYD1